MVLCTESDPGLSLSSVNWLIQVLSSTKALRRSINIRISHSRPIANSQLELRSDVMKHRAVCRWRSRCSSRGKICTMAPFIRRAAHVYMYSFPWPRSTAAIAYDVYRHMAAWPNHRSCCAICALRLLTYLLTYRLRPRV